MRLTNSQLGNENMAVDAVVYKDRSLSIQAEQIHLPIHCRITLAVILTECCW